MRFRGKNTVILDAGYWMPGTGCWLVEDPVSGGKPWQRFMNCRLQEYYLINATLRQGPSPRGGSREVIMEHLYTYAPVRKVAIADFV